MAITLNTDLEVSTGKLSNIELLQGAWRTVDTAATMNALTGSAGEEAKLEVGQIFYVQDEDKLYKYRLVGSGFFATKEFQEFEFPSSGSGSTPAGTISGSQQISDLGFIQSSQTSSFVLSSQTGSFLIAADTASFILVSQTSSMSVATASYISPTFISASAAAAGFGAGGSTPDGTISGSQQIIDFGFIQSSQTSSFVFVSQTSSMSVATASYIDPTFISASAAAAGFGAGGGGSIDTSSLVRIDQTSSMSVATASYALYAISASYEILTELSSSHAVNADTASFISDTFISASAARSGFGGGSSIDTSSFITNDQTSSFLLISETGSFLTAADTSSFVLVSQTSSMSVATASYIDPTFISSSAAAAGFGSGGGGSTPAGTVSGSQQIADLGYINQTQTSSMSVLSASYAVTASYAAVLEIGSEISGPGFSINQDGILTLSATTETGSLGAGSIWYDGNDFYFNV
jgi:hypothetical protein